MADVLRDALAVAQSEIDREVSENEPPDPLGYGKEVICIFDVTPRWDTLEDDDPLLVVNAVMRRFLVERLTLLDDEDYGLDLRLQWNNATTPAKIASLEAAARAEARKDDRVIDATVKITQTAERELTFSVALELESTEEIFTLTFRINDRGVELL